MKLKAVHLHPWAGQANRNISFGPGLNVVLGVNDIGKSSLFAAIERALFLPAKLTKPIFAKELQPFVPIGGDTAKVSLEMLNGSGEAGITLEKTWGSRPDAVLKFPGGREVREEEAIQKALEELIGVRAGTYRSIHLARQSHLARSLEELKTDRSPIEDLGSLLQKTLFETDGVSVEALRSKLQRSIDDHFSQWDSVARAPKDNRGIHNPWKREVGTLLAAFYKKAQAEKDFEETRKAEAELDRLQQELEKLKIQASQDSALVQERKALIPAIQERKALRAQLQTAQAEGVRIQEDLARWSAWQAEIAPKEQQLASLEERCKALESEQAGSENELKNRSLRETYPKARELKQRDEELLGRGRALKAQALACEEIKKAHTSLKELKASLKSGRLSVSFQALQPQHLISQRDIDGESRQELSSGSTVKLDAGGRIRLATHQFQLTVESGDGNFSEVARQAAHLEDQIRSLLLAQQLANLEMAEDVLKRQDETRNELKAVRESLKTLLGNETFESLEARFQELGESQAYRPSAQIRAELGQARDQLGAMRAQLESARRGISGLQAQYACTEAGALLQRAVKSQLSVQQFQEKLEALPKLPEAATQNEAGFLAEYQSAENRLDAQRSRHLTLESQRAALLASAPQASVQELEPQVTEAREEFERQLAHGRALVKVQSTLNQILQAEAPDTFGPLRQAFEASFQRLTAGKYGAPDLGAGSQEGVPQSFERTDRVRIPFQSLSTGMRDSAALGLRLSMAQVLGREQKGLLLLDDPLVNLDPAHAERAAREIQEFSAQGWQVVIFTCHPGHAEVLGGSRIELGSA